MAHSTNDALLALRHDLESADYRVERVDELLGDEATAALERGNRVPARRRISQLEPSPLSLLVRFFLLNEPLTADDAAVAFPTLGVAAARELGLLDVEGVLVHAALDLRPYSFDDGVGAGHWWLLSDLGELARGGALPEDHVLGVGGASMSLSGLMIPERARRVLDLGTGCGIQAMHASRFADTIVATDISERAVRLARLNFELNGIEGIELRVGDLFAPVQGETFDRLVSNPPFVITPRIEGVPSYEYRDGGLVGDALVEAVVRGTADILEPGGIAQFLANWEYREGADGLERIEGWLAGSGLEYWIIERERQDAAEYAETWIRDGGTRPGTEEFDRLADAWVEDFERRGVDAVGFGYVLVRKPTGAALLRRAERVVTPLGTTPLGLHLADCLDAFDRIAGLSNAELGSVAFTVAPDVTVERHYWPGDEDPTAMILRQGGGFGRQVVTGTALAAFVGASDGDLSLGAIAAALGELLGVDGAAVAAELVADARELVLGGFLLPAGATRRVDARTS